MEVFPTGAAPVVAPVAPPVPVAAPAVDPWAVMDTPVQTAAPAAPPADPWAVVDAPAPAPVAAAPAADPWAVVPDPANPMGQSVAATPPSFGERVGGAFKRIGGAIVQGVTDGFGSEPLGASPEMDAALQRQGVYPPAAGGGNLVQRFNEGVMRPAFAAGDAALRVGSAAIGGVISGAVRAGTEAVSPEFGRGIGGVLEATVADTGSRIPAHAPEALRPGEIRPSEPTREPAPELRPAEAPSVAAPVPDAPAGWEVVPPKAAEPAPPAEPAAAAPVLEVAPPEPAPLPRPEEISQNPQPPAALEPVLPPKEIAPPAPEAPEAAPPAAAEPAPRVTSPAEPATLREAPPGTNLDPREPVAPTEQGKGGGAPAPEVKPAEAAAPAGEVPPPVLRDAPLDAAPTTGDGPTRSPIEGTRPGRDFNEGTSPYRQVFRDAGQDPDLAVSRPLPEQNRVIADHIKQAFGFKDVEVDPKQNPKEIRDQLSNFYNSGREMANALGMPHSALGLDGKVTFTTKPYRTPKQALGSYAPGSRTINIPGRSNSFAHEWTHAMDHHLADVLANNPAAMKMLSRTKGLGDGEVGGKVAAPNSAAGAFVNVMKAIFGGDAPTALEALRLQHDVRAKDPNVFLKARARLDQIQTEYGKNAHGIQPSRYWADPAEMLARAHEAYVTHVIEQNGGDTRGVSKPYYDTPAGVKPDGFEKYYPQQAERDHIFQAFTDLHDQMRAEAVLGKEPSGARPNGLDIVDPRVWDKMADPTKEKGLWAVLKREVNAQKNLRAQLWDRMGFSPTAAEPGRLGLGTRMADTGRALTYSIRGIGNAITARQPEGLARDSYQHIMDLISPAEHVRSAKDAQGRYFGPVFEEDVREHARPNINRMANILDQHGLGAMTPQESLMLRHILTEGQAHSFVPDGSKTAVPVPSHITKAAGALRYLLDQEWERNRKAGIDVGYAKNGYFPRMYDDHKIFGDRPGFEKAADKLHRVIFEQEIGDDPAKLLAAHDRLPKDVQAELAPDVQDGVKDLRKNLKEQDTLMTRAGTPAEQPGDAARLRALRDEAKQLHGDIHDPVRDLYADKAAHDWSDRINNGDPTDFDTRGPNASFTNKRVLPPEADTIMRNYMVNDPARALPAYFQQSARKVAFANRFGVNGAKLDKLIAQASKGGARGEDNEAMRRLVEAVTGKQKSGLPPPVERAANVVHALGSIALMPRAAWSSLSEPMATLARTGNIKATYQAFANQLGDIVKTAGSKQRADMANALGLTTSSLYDSIIADRTEGHYRDAPGLNKLMTNYYKRTGLTQLTNSQRRSVMGAGHTALAAWSKDLLGTNKRLARDAAAQFRDLGVPDAKHASLAKWITEHPGLPSLGDLDSAGGRLWGQAVSRLTDKIIQDPMRADKPLMSQNPIGRLAYGLMSFNYAFYHNVIEHALDTHTARIGEGYSDVRAAGGNKARAVLGTAAPVGRALGHIGVSAAAIYAGSLASTALREAIFNGQKWQEQSDAGTLGEWLSDLAIQRTGINGPLDPIAQAISGLKYERDLSSLMAGAQAGYFLQAAGDMLKPFAGADPANTNTQQYNAIKGAWNMFGVPAAATALTALPGGPLASAAYGAAMQGVTSRGAADAVATKLVGPKGTGPDGAAAPVHKPKDPNAEPEGTGSGMLGGVPLGAVDDIAAPAAKVALPLFQRLPRAGKIAAGVGAAAAVGGKLANTFSQWKAD